MIAKQIIGCGFRGILAYLRHGSGGKQRERGEVLDTNLPATDLSPRALARSFGALRQLNGKLGRAVYHVSLSPAEGDEITDDQWRDIGRAYLAGMGFENCGFVLVKHENEADDVGGDSAGAKPVRPPHVHLVACRIRPDDGTTVSDQNNFRRSERVVREIEARYHLVQVASSIHNKSKPKENRKMNDKLKPYAQTWIEAAGEKAEEAIGVSIEPAAVYAIAPAHPMTDSQRRDYKREILEAEYQTILRDVFAESVRYVRRGKNGLTLHFRNGGRVVDSGDRVSAFAMDPKAAAAALIELSILKSWDGVTVTANGPNAVVFLYEFFALALAKGVTVHPKPDQLEIFRAVQRAHAARGGATPVAVASSMPPPPAHPIDETTLGGGKELASRLEERRAALDIDTDSESGGGAMGTTFVPKPVPVGPMGPKGLEDRLKARRAARMQEETPRLGGGRKLK